jgi:hypothetical protein
MNCNLDSHIINVVHTRIWGDNDDLDDSSDSDDANDDADTNDDDDTTESTVLQTSEINSESCPNSL